MRGEAEAPRRVICPNTRIVCSKNFEKRLRDCQRGRNGAMTGQRKLKPSIRKEEQAVCRSDASFRVEASYSRNCTVLRHGHRLSDIPIGTSGKHPVVRAPSRAASCPVPHFFAGKLAAIPSVMPEFRRRDRSSLLLLSLQGLLVSIAVSDSLDCSRRRRQTRCPHDPLGFSNFCDGHLLPWLPTSGSRRAQPRRGPRSGNGGGNRPAHRLGPRERRR